MLRGFCEHQHLRSPLSVSCLLNKLLIKPEDPRAQTSSTRIGMLTFDKTTGVSICRVDQTSVFRRLPHVSSHLPIQSDNQCCQSAPVKIEAHRTRSINHLLIIMAYESSVVTRTLC